MRQIDDHKVKPYYFFFLNLVLQRFVLCLSKGGKCINCVFETHYRMGWNWKLLIGLLQIHVQPHLCDVMCDVFVLWG